MAFHHRRIIAIQLGPEHSELFLVADDPVGPGPALTVNDEGFNYRSLRANSVFR